MAAQTMTRTGILRFTLATTLTRVDYIAAVTPVAATQYAPATTVAATPTFPVGSREIPVVVWITPDVDCYVVCDGTSEDGGALPTHYDKIPAGTKFPWQTRGSPLLLAGASAGAVSLVLT